MTTASCASASSSCSQTFEDVEFLGAGAGGEEAVALCAEHQPDVLLLDLSMPDLDGIEVTATLCTTCARDEGRGVHVVLRPRAHRAARSMPAPSATC